VVAEGAAKASDIAAALKKKTTLDVRVSILGHIQRGGAPTALSREVACKLGARAVQLLIEGKAAMMVGIQSDKIIETPMEEVARRKKKIDLATYKLANMLAT
jgi:6-phosphofructokinase 1